MQDVLALAIVAAAVAYLAWKLVIAPRSPPRRKRGPDVTVRGLVAIKEEKRMVERDVWYVEGVRDVVNELDVYAARGVRDATSTSPPELE